VPFGGQGNRELIDRASSDKQLVGQGKEAYSSWGIQATASAGVGETKSDKRPEVRSRTPVDNCRGASGLERGTRPL